MLTGAALDRLFAEHLHPVDQRADAVGLVADQHRQFAVRSRDAVLQQLRGAADARERVLDLMRQDRRHAGDAARGAAERQLPVERPRRGGVLQNQHAPLPAPPAAASPAR